MPEKSKKYNEVLKATRHQAIKLLQLCEDAQEGKISGEEFEKRTTKMMLQPYSPGLGYTGQTFDM